ncbi:MAG TPA: hypothetical protein VNK24_07610 [Elusimicrobiota bacterium]|nr:hypothetical protein [Elusimicrobiota bacterium]
MKRTLCAAIVLLSLACSAALAAPEPYGAKGIFPVYESGGQWLIFDKSPGPRESAWLSAPRRYLVIGSDGSGIFWVARDSASYGGACRQSQPLSLRTALLKGPRSLVGHPIIAIHVPLGFSLKGSRAVFRALGNAVSDPAYQNLYPALDAKTVEEIKQGLVSVDFSTAVFDQSSTYSGPKPQIQTVIDFAAKIPVEGLMNASVLVTESTVGNKTWRCLREADGSNLAGACALMPRKLMAETDLLQFVSYDPSGDGHPFLFAYTKRTPLWGNERWGFSLGPEGPKVFLMDAMDIRCREGF